VVLEKDTEEVENIKIIDFGFSNYLSKLIEKKDSDGTARLLRPAGWNAQLHCS
jgi:hypothetical protein